MDVAHPHPTPSLTLITQKILYRTACNEVNKTAVQVNVKKVSFLFFTRTDSFLKVFLLLYYFLKFVVMNSEKVVKL